MLSADLSVADIAMIKRVIAASPSKPLTVLEFVEHAGFPIEHLMVDQFFHSLRKKSKIYISPSVIEYFGYEGKDYTQRASFLQTLEKHFQIDKNYFVYNNEEYKAFYARTTAKFAKKIAKEKKEREEELLAEMMNEKSGSSEKESENPGRQLPTQNSDAEEKNPDVGTGEKSESPEKEDENPYRQLPIRISDVDEKNSDVDEEKKDPVLEIMSKCGYPSPDEFIGVNGKNPTKHIILTTKCFRKLMMKLRTKKADEVQEFYLAMEDLVAIYSAYQTEYTGRDVKNLRRENGQLTGKVDELTGKVDELLKRSDQILEKNDQLLERVDNNAEMIADLHDDVKDANFERAPRTKSKEKWDMLYIHRVVPHDKNGVAQSEHFYVTRGMAAYVRQRLRKIEGKMFKSAKEVIHIPYQPNAKNLFNLIQQELYRVIDVKGTKIYLQPGYTSDQFIEDVKRIHAERCAAA